MTREQAIADEMDRVCADMHARYPERDIRDFRQMWAFEPLLDRKTMTAKQMAEYIKYHRGQYPEWWPDK
jgi:hypothetical protein